MEEAATEAGGIKGIYGRANPEVVEALLKASPSTGLAVLTRFDVFLIMERSTLQQSTNAPLLLDRYACNSSRNLLMAVA